MALETYVLLKEKAKAQALAKTIASNLSAKRYMSTQSTAYSLIAMAKFAEMVGGKGIKTSITVNGKSESIRTEKTLANRPIKVKKGSNKITIKNQEGNTVYVSIVNSGILPVGEEKTIQNNLAVTMSFKARNGQVQIA